MGTGLATLQEDYGKQVVHFHQAVLERQRIALLSFSWLIEPGLSYRVFGFCLSLSQLLLTS